MGEVVFCDEFFGDVGEADANVFGTIERSAEIEVVDVEGYESGAFERDDAIDHEIDKFEWGGFGADVAGVADTVAADGDASAVGIGFFGTDFANDLGVSDFFAAVGRDVVVVNYKEGDGAVDVLVGAFWVGAYALAEASEFVGVGFIPNLVELGVFAELTVFESLACFAVKNWH